VESFLIRDILCIFPPHSFYLNAFLNRRRILSMRLLRRWRRNRRRMFENFMMIPGRDDNKLGRESRRKRSIDGRWVRGRRIGGARRLWRSWMQRE
jgi:hypothetical protein